MTKAQITFEKLAARSEIKLLNYARKASPKAWKELVNKLDSETLLRYNAHMAGRSAGSIVNVAKSTYKDITSKVNERDLPPIIREVILGTAKAAKEKGIMEATNLMGEGKGFKALAKHITHKN